MAGNDDLAEVSIDMLSSDSEAVVRIMDSGEPPVRRRGLQRASILLFAVALLVGAVAVARRAFPAQSLQTAGFKHDMPLVKVEVSVSNKTAQLRRVWNTSNATVDVPTCSGKGENCLKSKCCKDSSMHCFSKAEYWATCLGSCIAGVHPEDGPKHKEPWNCGLLGSKSVPMTTIHWNVHWQCSRATDGSTGACRTKAASRLVELAKKSGAHVAVAIELAHNSGTPLRLPDLGLANWTQVDGKCIGFNADLWDSLALTFSPGWQVLKSGGGCLNGRGDTRAFAVARVRPPWEVRECPELCVAALHAPHNTITEGRDVVSRVCGAAVGRCMVALGDWNVPIGGGIHGGVANRWAELVNGAAPNFILPNERTCCNPEWKYHGFYDHLATNILGAHTEGSNGSTGYAVYPYQILEDNPVEEHKPLSVWLQLPAAESVTKSK